MPRIRRTAAALAASLSLATGAMAQTGVSDDRVSLPAGPGSLEGVGENVSLDPNMGTMSYGVPIEVPQGFPGVTPTLRLAYSSGAGSSVVGVGWMLDVPHIERGTVFGLPSYDRGDLFTVDGASELVEVPGAATPTYRARYERGFVRYTWLEAGDGAEGYWQAEYPDGRVATFGARADGTAVPDARVAGPDGTFRYMMVESVDVYGHRMAYTYRKSGAVSLLSEVEYVFDDASAARYRVALSYEDRIDDTGFDFLSDAKPGFDERLTERLAAVDVFSGPDRIRRYDLAYEPYADAGGFTRLAEISVRGAEGGLHPAVQRFTYSKTLEGVCDGADCARPFVIDMGNIGVNIGIGRATFIDINGDALPDLVDTTDDGAHRFLLNQLDINGDPRFAADPTMSALGLGSGFRLGTPFVQVLDVNGDGFADLLDARNGQALLNRGVGDWAELAPLADTADISDALGADVDAGELQNLRFIDLDNDKRIDLLRSTREETIAWFNQGPAGFNIREDIDQLPYDLLVDGVQMADMNGDGLLDAVRLDVGGLRYMLNLGRGRWGEEVEVLGVQLDESELDIATLDDINGDGLSDLVVVSGREVGFAINRNGETFSQVATLDSDDVDGELPLRDATVTVLMADINGNGSTDIVWLDAEGQATALELFPLRPNQLARVENSLGKITDITYTTSVQQMALDGGWAYTLPHPMLIVERVDNVDLLSGITETATYRYRDGYYDGVEKRFRGYGRVEVTSTGDETQEEGLTVYTYDVGVDDAYRHGLMLTQATFSAGRALGETHNTYADCPVAEADDTDKPVRHLCLTESDSIVMEGAAASEHVTLRTQSTYDGYGNATLEANLGVIARGGAECGSACLGDETYTEIEYVQPGADTDGRWILGAPFRTSTTGEPASALATESLIYYDGPDFEGLPLGTLTLGAVTRTTEKVADDHIIETSRIRRDADGNVVEQLDPLGAPGQPGHRTLYTMDDTGLRVTAVDISLVDDAGEPYSLRQEIAYEPLFDNIVEGTAWMRVDADGDVRSARRSSLWTYDEFGRLASTVSPGDTLDAPTETYTYDLGSPLSRVITQSRSTRGGPLDIETVTCIDGRGRTFQNRTHLGGGDYQITDFSLFNTAGQAWRMYQPYVSASADCDLTPPEDTRFSEVFRDAAGRALRSTVPDGEIFGAASLAETRYGPLTVTTFDLEDSDAQSPHADTPTTQRTDGLGRLIALERTLADGRAAITEMAYDPLGRLIEHRDPDGNVKRQTYDLMGRALRIDDPNKSGPTLLTYDDAHNLITREDGRGVVLQSRYDGLNRLVEQWDDADRDGTLERTVWDHDPDCDAAVCSNTAAQPVRVEYRGLGGDIDFERYGYDVRGRRVRTDRQMEGVPLTFEVAYDNADRAVAVTYPNARTLTYRYDPASRLIGVDGVIDAIDYEARGALAGYTLADGTRVEQTYDALMQLAARRITGPSGEALQALDYTRDREGNLLEIEDTALVGPDLGATFEYDAWYRATTIDAAPTAADGGERLTSTYDLIGNVTERSSTRTETPTRLGAYRFESGAPNALTRAGDLTLAYDAAGHATRRGGQTFVWDAHGRATEVFDGDTLTVRYGYGVGPLRTAKIEGDSTTLYADPAFELRDGISTLYVALGRNRIARIEDAALATTALTDLAPLGAPDDRIDAADAYVALAGAADAPADPDAAGPLLHSAVRRMFVERGPETTYLHHDHQGSIVMATHGETGEVIGARSFTPMGAERGDGFGYVDTYGFTGAEHDAATGLVRYDNRLLDPTTGRWMSADPRFALMQGEELTNPTEALGVYGYAADNYANNVDPTGLNNEKATGGKGASGDAKSGGSGTAKAAKANKVGRLAKAGKACANFCKDLKTVLANKLKRMAGDTTTIPNPALATKAQRAEGRAKFLRNENTIKRVRQVIAAGNATKGALEIALGVTEIADGDVIGGAMGIAGGANTVRKAAKELYKLSKLDPKNPEHAKQLTEGIPRILDKAATYYENKASSMRKALDGRIETDMLSRGWYKGSDSQWHRVDKNDY